MVSWVLPELFSFGPVYLAIHYLASHDFTPSDMPHAPASSRPRYIMSYAYNPAPIMPDIGPTKLHYSQILLRHCEAKMCTVSEKPALFLFPSRWARCPSTSHCCRVSA